MLRAIVFDFDGVIANSEPLHCRAFRDALARRGITLTEADYYSQYLGYDDVGAIRAVAADRGLHLTTDQITAIVDAKAERFEELQHSSSVLFPGAEALVRAAASAMPVGIASGALRAEILRVLDAAGLADLFGAIVAAEDTPLSKPAPDPYRRAVHLLSEASGQAIDPSECVAIEDSRWGLQSARDAGLRTVGVAQTYEASALQGVADLVVATVEELDLTILRSLFAP